MIPLLMPWALTFVIRVSRIAVRSLCQVQPGHDSDRGRRISSCTDAFDQPHSTPRRGKHAQSYDSGPSEHLASRSSLRAQVTVVTDEMLLASGWQRFFHSSTGKAYYRNGTTDVTQWELPTILLDSRSTMQRWCDATKGDPRPCFFWDSAE